MAKLRSITRRTALIGAGSAGLVSSVGMAFSPLGWLAIGERIAEGCLRDMGANAIADALRSITGSDAARLHESSLREIAAMMKQAFHVERIWQLNRGIEALVRTMDDYRRARGTDRLEFATNTATELVAHAEGICRDENGDYWFPGLASFATAVSVKIAILQERAKAFGAAGELCNIENERNSAKAVIKAWAAARDQHLRSIVTDPVRGLVGGTEPGELATRPFDLRVTVWSTDVEGDTQTLKVDCGWFGGNCTFEQEQRQAMAQVKAIRTRIDRERFGSTEQSARRMSTNWSKLAGCRSAPPPLPAVVAVAPSVPPTPPTTVVPSPLPRPVPEEVEPATQFVPKPVYPRRALAAGRAGRVSLRFSIDAAGVVQDIVVVSVEPKGWNFEGAAIEALRRGRFSPQRVNGVPMKTTGHRVEFVFSLDER